MGNLRILTVEVVDSTNLEVSFTDTLISNLTISNVSIVSDTPNVPDAEVIGLKVSGKTLKINCLPLSPLATYFVEFKSVQPLYPFISLHGTNRLLEDGVANKYLILGPMDSNNPVKNYLESFLNNNIYDLDNSDGLISKYIRALSIALSRALYDIRQVKNENYLSFTVTDEKKIRGPGAFDRLTQEGAYEIIRVGRGPTASKASKTFTQSEFPSFPITLQRETEADSLTVSSVNEIGKFNINDLILNLDSYPVTKVTSIVFTLATSTPNYVYNIETLGYQIKNSRYDQNFAFSYALLADNQIKLNDAILQDPLFALDSILKVDVQYEYKDLGVVVDESSVKVTSTLESIREVLPPIINIFSLAHSPVVDVNGNLATLGAVTFTDPNSNVPGAKHPAFKNEVLFRLNALPSMPGQYSIDYSTGTVYVYGADFNNDGTGPFPPLATYKYQLTYNSELDYVYDPGLLDLVALPLGNLLGNPGKINFKYEKVFVPGVDYNSALHQEELTERIGNNLLAVNVLRTKHSPITNVFRIFNETSGEIYTLNRWNNDKVYFRYNTPPRINNQLAERITFNNVNNELLFVDTSFTNTNSLKIFKIFLNNNHLISSTEDSIGSSFNTSVSFSDGYIFAREKWFNRSVAESINTDNLSNVGEYSIDYVNGIVFVAVSSTQGFNLGTISYKKEEIVPQFPHLISVEDLYYRITSLNPKNKQFAYTFFEDGSIIPSGLEPCDELFLNNSDDEYQIYNGNIGVFSGSGFIPGVTNQVNFVRSIFEYTDLTNNTNPINFSLVSDGTEFSITVGSIEKELFNNVQYNVTDGYYVLVDENIPYLSSNIDFDFSVSRVSDGYSLWNGSGVIVAGNPVKLKLPGINNPQVGDLVKINYTFTINDLSRVVIDYNKGDFFADYTYLADEIIVSYEYGDNVIDFRRSKSISPNTEYYVSYKAGALRDALLKNFGILVNIPELSNFDIDFNRERYRDALMAALSSFIQGPTVNAIKNIGRTISHIEPEIIESIFNGWSLGSSLLTPQTVNTTGTFQLLPGKYANGVLINEDNQSISLPASSNLRLEEGTFETWITPEWNGLDNNSDLSFSILKDGYVIDSNEVFIGSAEDHPEINNGFFSLSKLSNIGSPNLNKDGVFIYYDLDASGLFYRWYFKVIDGYVSAPSSTYKIKINSSGMFYDVKNVVDGYVGVTNPANFRIFTGNNSVNLTLTGGSPFNKGITFISDTEHYLLDVGKEETKNRISLFKDPSGYFNFRVYDQDGLSYVISADVSNWQSGDLHHVAASWKLNTRNTRDEMHLFIDGLEVPNIIRYGQKLGPYLHEKFRTVNPEEILGLPDYDIVGSTDLHTTMGSNIVSSAINFSGLNIAPGNKIFIDELGYDPDGYTILSISGQNLTLNANMPSTLTNGRFSVNQTEYVVKSEINTAPNIAVSTIHSLVTGSLSGTAGSSTVTSSTNFTTEGVLAGYSIKIDDPSTPDILHILSVSGTSLILDDILSDNLSGVDFWIYDHNEVEIPGVRALHPAYSISKDGYYNDVLTLSNDVEAGDLVLIRTLGLNHRRVKTQYYVWSNNIENTLMTRLPPPISLDEVKITKVLLANTAIGPANSTFGSGVFTSNNLPTSSTSNSGAGRSVVFILAGNNADFSTPAQVTINGVNQYGVLVNEVVSATDYGTWEFTNKFMSVNYVKVVVKPMVSTRAALTILVKEKYPLTYSENSAMVPVVRFSYNIGGGYSLQSDGYNTVRDENKTFSYGDIGNTLIINSPASVAGFYKIIGVSGDRHGLVIESTVASFTLPLSSFTDGIYQILNSTSYRSGLQGGFFNFEVGGLPSQAYYLSSGFYEIEYLTYARIKFNSLDAKMFLGSDFNSSRQIDSVMDQVKIYSVMLTDTRVGEFIPSNQRSITKDYNSLKPLSKDPNTLVLLALDEFPFVNEADYYINSTLDKHHFQSSVVVNENFNNSIVILDKPIMVENEGILDSRREGTIEFWTSPIYDTGNDPVERYYFDAYGAIVEDVVSIDNSSLKLSGSASEILSVRLVAGDDKIDYFAGGRIELDSQRAISEELTSVGNNSVVTTKQILQVLSVKIAGDFTHTDYFADGSVGPDKKTIYLGKLLPASNLEVIVTYTAIENNNDLLNKQIIRLNRRLPYQNTPVRVIYLPKGIQGDRMSIFKDVFGYLNFRIIASGTEYLVRGPTRWVKDSWHRVKASYKINHGVGKDEMRLFLDGYEYTNVVFGEGAVFGPFPVVFGGVTIGDGYSMLGKTIKFKDPINELFIGSQYNFQSPIFSLIDNFRISNISRPIYAPYGESIDVNYSSNLSNVFPVTEDLYTTYLLDFNSLIIKNTDFVTIQNRETGLFDFSVNIFDSLGIIESSIKSKEALEKLIRVLKPANSKVFINYLK